MSKLYIPAVLAAATALMSMPVLAQDAPPPPPGPKAAQISLDFGAGRQIRIHCGDASLDACIASATPLIDKVAEARPFPGPGFGGKNRDGHPGPEGRKGPGHENHDHSGPKPDGDKPEKPEDKKD